MKLYYLFSILLVAFHITFADSINECEYIKVLLENYDSTNCCSNNGITCDTNGHITEM